ncbi:MAG: apolipoprotein N-acyltransferase [Calditrichota bacterium]
MLSGFGFLLSALLGIISFPPFGGWPIAFVAMIPFLVSSVSLPPAKAWKWGYLSGFIFFGGTLYWIGLNSGAPPPLAWASAVVVVAILATVWAITAGAVARTAHRHGLKWAALLFVILYVFQEVFWGTGELGFPWIVWGLSQTGFLPAMQMADLVDIYGLSVWVLAVNALLFLAWKRAIPRTRAVWIALLVISLPLIYGWARIRQFRDGEPIHVAAVQANTPVDRKWHMSAEEITADYLRYSAPLSDTGTRLVVWPETATPAPIRYRPWLRSTLQRYADSTGMYLLTGATDYEQMQNRGMVPYNAAFLFRPGDRDLLHSAKIHLVPFGERIPGQKLFPFLGKLHLGQAEWEPAKDIVVFPPEDGLPAHACLICFEVVFPDIAARVVKGGAALLTTITNDGWYGNSSGPYQHLALARLRAVAVRRSMVRSANTGISALILPTGEVKQSLGYDRAGAIFGTVPTRHEITSAVRLSLVWPYLYSVMLLSVIVILGMKARRTGGSRAS